MPQLVALAYAAFEQNFAEGVDEARGKVFKWLIERDVLAELPPSNDPFGTDPALLASIGRGDQSAYHAPVPVGERDKTFPVQPVNAGGQ